jgi:hypothetical protein
MVDEFTLEALEEIEMSVSEQFRWLWDSFLNDPKNDFYFDRLVHFGNELSKIREMMKTARIEIENGET